MCRLTAILSTRRPVCVADVVTYPKHSIIYQSYNCKERFYFNRPTCPWEQSTLNGDGFGVGWYVPHEQAGFLQESMRPCVFNSLKPAWSDKNLQRIAEKTLSPLVFAHVLASGPCLGPTELTCQPFSHGRFLFMHNGTLGKFPEIRKAMLLTLSSKAAFDFAMERTPIDSILLFAMFIDLLEEGSDADYSAEEIRSKLVRVLSKISEILDRHRVEQFSLMNIVVSDGRQMVACRYSIGPYSTRQGGLDPTPSPSLYFATGTQWAEIGPTEGEFRMLHANKRNEVCIITSEPLTDAREEWVSVPHNHTVVVSSNCDVLIAPVSFAAPGDSVSEQPRQTSLSAFTGHMEPPTPPCIPDDIRRPTCRKALKIDELPVLSLTEVEVLNSRILAAGHQGGFMSVWDLQIDALVGLFPCHKGSILALQTYFDGDTVWLISGSSDTTICFWDLKQLVEDWKSEAPRGLAAADTPGVAPGSAGPNLKSCDTASGYYRSRSSFQQPSRGRDAGDLLRYLKLRLQFFPIQGDVLSMAIAEYAGEAYLQFGFQSTRIGAVGLKSLTRHIQHCGCMPNDGSARKVSCALAAGLTADFLGAPQLILEATTTQTGGGELEFRRLQSETPGIPAKRRTPAQRSQTQLPKSQGCSSVITDPGIITTDDSITATAHSLHGMPSGGCLGIDWFLFCSRTHTGFIEALCPVGKEGDMLASGGGDGLVILWEKSRFVSRLSGHSGGVLCLAATTEGKLLYSGGRDCTIRVWDVGSRACRQVLRKHQAEVIAISVTPTFLVSASSTQEVFLWSLRWHHVTWQLSPENESISCSIAAISYLAEWSSVVVACSDGKIRFWNLEERRDEAQPAVTDSFKSIYRHVNSDSPNNDHDAQSELFMISAHSRLASALSPPRCNLTSKSVTTLQTATDLLEQLVAMRTISGRSTFLGECWQAANFISKCLDSIGAHSRLVPTGPHSAPIVMARLGEDPSKPTIMLYSHYDVVSSGESSDSPGNLESIDSKLSPPKLSCSNKNWASDPWELITLNGYFWGRGATDNKGPLVAQILAIAELLRGDCDFRFYAEELHRLTEGQTPVSRFGLASRPDSNAHRPEEVTIPVGQRAAGSSARTSATAATAVEVGDKMAPRLAGSFDKSADEEAEDILSDEVTRTFAVPPTGDCTVIREQIPAARVNSEDGHANSFGVAWTKQLAVEEDQSSSKSSRAVEDLPINILFVCEGEEENGSLGFPEFLRDNRNLLSSVDAALFTNTYWMDDELPCLVHGMRGVIDLKVEVKGGDDPVGLHSGIHGGAVAEPMVDAVALASCLVDSQGCVLVPGFYDDVAPAGSPPTSPASRRNFSIDKYRKEIGNAGLRELDANELLRRRWLQPTLSVTEVYSSTQTGATNVSRNFRVLPSKVGFNVSIRFVPNQSSAKLIDRVERCLKYEFARRRSPNKLTVSISKCHPWWQGDTNSALFKSAECAVTSVWGVAPLCVREGGTIPVIQLVQDELQIPTIQVPIGQASDNAHLPNEKIRCLNLLNGIEVLKMTLWGFKHLAKLPRREK